MAVSAEQRSKIAALHQQWWGLQMNEKYLSGTKNSKQTNQKESSPKNNQKNLDLL